MKEVVKEVNRRSIEPCHECHGRRVSTYETYEDSYDRTYAESSCRSCGGKGTIGGGQPGLHLWFHTDEERDAFKEKLLHMRGIKWEDEGHDTLEVKLAITS